jgi:flagellar hook-length control protein FliK
MGPAFASREPRSLTMDISAALPIKTPTRSHAADLRADDDARAFADELAQSAEPEGTRDAPAEPCQDRHCADDQYNEDQPNADETVPEAQPAMLTALLGLQAAPQISETTSPAASQPLTQTLEAQVPGGNALSTKTLVEQNLNVPPAGAPKANTASKASEPTIAGGQFPAATLLAQMDAPATTVHAASAQQSPDTKQGQQQTNNAAATPAATEGQAPVLALQMAAALAAPAAPKQPATSIAKQSAADKKTDGPASAAHALAAPTQTVETPAPLKAVAQEGLKQVGANLGGANAGANVLAQGAQQTAPKDIKVEAGFALPATAPAPAQVAASPPAPTLVPHSAPVLVPPEALAATIARKALDGTNRFEIRLDPVELGRLDVTIEVDESGHTRAHIRAERPEALELLQRDAKGMEQALRQAGLQTDTSSLSFSLAERHKQDADPQSGHGRKAKFHAVLPADDINAAVIQGRTTAASGLDLRV